VTPNRTSQPTLAGALFPSDLRDAKDGATLTVAGRLVSTSGTSLVIADAFTSCSARLSSGRELAVGCWVEVQGEFARASSTLQRARVVAVHDGKAPACGGQFRRLSKVGAHLQRRAHAKAAVREYFIGRGYLEVDTPVRVSAPGTDVYLEPQPCGDAWLITSPEFQHKRLLAGGLPRIFEFAHCTRRDEVGLWHQPEFTMLEWYCLLQDFEGLLGETERLVLHLARALDCSPTITVKEHEVHLDRGFERLTVAEAFRNYAGVSDVAALAANDEDRYFQLMVDFVDPALSCLERPVLLTHYPLSQAALAAPSAGMPGFSDRFELFIGGVELCNGYGELTNSAIQRERFEADVRKRRERGLREIPLDEGLLAALDEGVPPCSGNAVGFDRLLAVLLEQPLSGVVAFPAKLPE
jgi:elongation factor P--(R)-beta-lysine ligase